MRLSGTLALEAYMASLLAFCLDLLPLSDFVMRLMLDDTLAFLEFAFLTMFIPSRKEACLPVWLALRNPGIVDCLDVVLTVVE